MCNSLILNSATAVARSAKNHIGLDIVLSCPEMQYVSFRGCDRMDAICNGRVTKTSGERTRKGDNKQINLSSV